MSFGKRNAHDAGSRDIAPKAFVARQQGHHAAAATRPQLPTQARLVPADREPARAEAAPAQQPAPPLTSAVFTERIAALLADVRRVAGETKALGRAIRLGERFNTQPFEKGFAPDAYPIDIAGFSRHFNFRRDGTLKHGVLAMVVKDKKLDCRPQLHLFELTSAIMSINSTCITAQQDGALAIAMQSDVVRINVDRGIALSCLVGGLLEILLYQHSILTGTKVQRERGPEAAKARAIMSRWEQEARETMIDAGRFEQSWPKHDPATLLGELEMPDHAGQLVMNNVYLPSELAQPIRARLAAEQAKAMASAQH